MIALKRPNNHTQVIVYEVNRNRTRHHKMCEFTVAYPVQSLQILSDMRLAIGHQSGFTAYFLQGEAQAMCKCNSWTIGVPFFFSIDEFCDD